VGSAVCVIEHHLTSQRRYHRCRIVERMSEPESFVRPATPDDAEAMAQVHDRSYRRFYRGILPDEAMNFRSIDDRIAEWRHTIESGVGYAAAAIVGGEIVGVSFAFEDTADDVPARTGHLTTLFVDPEHIRRGHGHALLDDAVEWFRARRLTSAVLWCLQENNRARRFYEAQGWTLDPSALPRQIGPYEGVREVRYRRAVDGDDAVRTIVGTG
jgi:GNAT superfamily N-acetyltransferase